MSREMVVETGLWYKSQGPATCDVGPRITLQRGQDCTVLSLGRKTTVSTMKSISRRIRKVALSGGASNEGSREA